jgi:hypothetical protein
LAGGQVSSDRKVQGLRNKYPYIYFQSDFIKYLASDHVFSVLFQLKKSSESLEHLLPSNTKLKTEYMEVSLPTFCDDKIDVKILEDDQFPEWEVDAMDIPQSVQTNIVRLNHHCNNI